jgi:hypothetical protein
LTAGGETTVLRLARGGEVHVCPRTAVTVTSSQNGKQIMLSMNTGGMEAHYSIGPATDAIVTPDFRMALTGPGQFEFAITDDKQGNTCVRALTGNTSSLFVTELMGEASYQVKSNEQVVFHHGRLSQADHNIPPDCGCAISPAPVQRAQVPAPAAPDAASLNGTARLSQGLPDEYAVVPPTISASNLPSERVMPASVSMSPAAPVTAPPPSIKPQDIHVQVDAPLSFNAADGSAAQPQAPPANAETSATTTAKAEPPPQPVPPNSAAAPATIQPAPARATDPPAPATQSRHGFFGKIGGFFGSIFGKKSA